MLSQQDVSVNSVQQLDGFQTLKVPSNNSMVNTGNQNVVFNISPGTFDVKKSFLQIPIEIYQIVNANAGNIAITIDQWQIGTTSFVQFLEQIVVYKNGKMIMNNQAPQQSQQIYYNQTRKLGNVRSIVYNCETSQPKTVLQATAVAGYVLQYKTLDYPLDLLLSYCFAENQKTFDVQTNMIIELRFGNIPSANDRITGFAYAGAQAGQGIRYKNAPLQLVLRQYQNLRVPDIIQSYFFLQKFQQTSINYQTNLDQTQESHHQIIGIIPQTPDPQRPLKVSGLSYIKQYSQNGVQVINSDSWADSVNQVQQLNEYSDSLIDTLVSVIDQKITNKALQYNIQTVQEGAGEIPQILIGIQYYQ